MKAEELRIGNYVYDEGDLTTYIQITSIQEDNTEWLQPIPLTEEWILKFGWYKHELIEGSFRKEGKPYDQFQIAWRNGILTYYIVWHQLVPLKYVHQLQNLYFSLTGEELTIKE